MKILYIEKHHGNSFSYYNEMMRALMKYNKIYQFANWANSSTISDILSNCPEKPDLICFGFGWTDCGDNYPKEIKGIKECNIPIAIILNKEYTGLVKKLDWIKNLNPVAAFSVHHNCEIYEEYTFIPFHKIPFAVNETIFKDYGQKNEYDFGFSGVVRPEQISNWREKIRESIKSWKNIRTFFTSHQHDNLTSYAKRINSTKIWLSTSGPANIIGPRYYEVMASGTTLLICNRMKEEYNDLFEEDTHCVMFDSLEEFEEKITYYLSHDIEREKIIKRAHEHVLGNHTWAHRGQKITNILNKALEGYHGKA